MEVGVIDSWWCGRFQELGRVEDGVWFRCESRRSVRGYWRETVEFKILCEIMVKVEAEMLGCFFASCSNSLVWQEEEIFVSELAVTLLPSLYLQNFPIKL